MLTHKTKRQGAQERYFPINIRFFSTSFTALPSHRPESSPFFSALIVSALFFLPAVALLGSSFRAASLSCGIYCCVLLLVFICEGRDEAERRGVMRTREGKELR